ncbi:hypothetical protein MMPV_006583 [Pyropia vietnamensis]
MAPKRSFGVLKNRAASTLCVTHVLAVLLGAALFLLFASVPLPGGNGSFGSRGFGFGIPSLSSSTLRTGLDALSRPAPVDSTGAPLVPAAVSRGWVVGDVSYKMPDFEAPLVFEAYVENATDFYLYAQGTLVLFSGSTAPDLDVKACRAGEDSMVMAARWNNVFHCKSHRPLVKGEPLTLLYANETAAGGLSPVESKVIHNGVVDVSSVGAPKYYTCASTQVKNTEYLADWLAYHRRIGVDHFYLYDNSANGTLAADMDPQRDDTDVLHWPWRKSQQQANSHMATLGRARCHWMLFSDVDEFVYVKGSIGKKATPLRVLLAQREAAGKQQVSLYRLEMGSSGVIHKSDAPLAETYIKRRKGKGLWLNYKSAVLLKDAIPYSRVHFFDLRAKPLGFNWAFIAQWDEMQLMPEWDWFKVWDPRGHIVHYSTKSWSEYIAKYSGDLNGMIPNIGFERFNYTVDKPPSFWPAFGGVYRDTAFRDYKRRVDKRPVPAPMVVIT